MKNFIIGFLVGGIVGAGVGYAGGIFAFPYLFPPPPVNETVPDKIESDVRARGRFIHADPSDPIHYGRGTVTAYDDLLHLGDDFEVGPGPKFHVYLVPESNITSDTNVAATMFVDLGRLKAFTGSQNYPIPAGIDLADYPSVVVWCEQFGVLITPAALTLSP